MARKAVALFAFWGVSDARLLVEPAAEQAHVAHVGTEHDVECVARERDDADDAVEGDISEHARGDVHQGAPSALASCTSQSEIAVVMMSPTTGINPINPSMP
ncbi:hypothetical protein ACVWZ6_008168 [Bradyrhizobium sp. GM6.1]